MAVARTMVMENQFGSGSGRPRHGRSSMGLFDSIRDAIRPDDDPESVDAGDQANEAKHVDRSAPPEFLDDPVSPDAQTGGKHARRD
jgi:hypothetical protein